MSKKPNLYNLTKHIYTLERNYNLLNQLNTETQQGIEVNYTQDVKSHSHTLSFLDQSIHTTQKTKHKKTLITLNDASPIELSYSIEARTQTISYPNGTQEHYSFNEAKELTALHRQRDGRRGLVLL